MNRNIIQINKNNWLNDLQVVAYHIFVRVGMGKGTILFLLCCYRNVA